jgi:Helix-turn-helix domain
LRFETGGRDIAPPFLVEAMTGDELRRCRLALGLTLDEFARLVRVSSGRTVRKWEDGEREVPGPVAVLTELFLLSSDAWRRRCQMRDMTDAFRCKCR